MNETGNVIIPYVPSLSDCLFDCTVKGDIDELKRLIDLGCDVNTSDDRVLWKATHAACCYNQPGILKLLIDAGGVINEQCGKYGHETPLQYALRSKSQECVHLLIKHGADINVRDFRWESVISLLSYFCFDIALYKNILLLGHKVNDIFIEGDILPNIPYEQKEFRIEIRSLLEKAGAFSLRRFQARAKEKEEFKIPQRLQILAVDCMRKELLRANQNSNLLAISLSMSVAPGVKKLVTEGLVSEFI